MWPTVITLTASETKHENVIKHVTQACTNLFYLLMKSNTIDSTLINHTDEDLLITHGADTLIHKTCTYTVHSTSPYLLRPIPPIRRNKWYFQLMTAVTDESGVKDKGELQKCNIHREEMTGEHWEQREQKEGVWWKALQKKRGNERGNIECRRK